MYLTPFTTLTWAYQLHYYLCFRTYRRRAFFSSESATEVLTELVREICARHDYHLLQLHIYPDQVRCLLSLQPAQAISKVIQTLKANSSRECGLRLELTKPVWASGYLARSVGRMRIGAVKEYLEQQAQHHGYDRRVLPPIYRYRAHRPVTLGAAHSAFELNHHLVLSTQYRHGVFTCSMGEMLSRYWLKVAALREFAIDQVTVVPDHVHLIVRVVPKMSIEECALLLMNNGQHFISQRYPEILVHDGLTQLWQASAYGGTCGKLTTALLKYWLSRSE